MTILIPDEFLRQIRSQSEKDYPRETCGILTGPKKAPAKITGIFPCRNVQDEYHARDSQNFPRTSATAYFIDPRDLLRVEREARQNECEMRAIYHSHVNAGAYFSEEDQRMALSEGEPAYPGVAYLVVSVKESRAGEAALFCWDPQTRVFLKTPLELK